MQQNIDFIYFDVGGVCILDFSKTNKWNQMLDDLNIYGNLRDKFEELFTSYELEICVGLDLNEFVKSAENDLNIKFPANYSMLDDFIDRFDPNPSLREILQDLVGKYKLGLLTNMYPRMLEGINKRNLLPSIPWDTIVDSSIVKARKPQAEIYEIAERQAGISPDNILFVENSQTHIDAAIKRGWQTLLYDPANIEESNRILQEYLEK